MVAVDARRHELRGTDGFQVQTADGPVGWVEEVWLDAEEAPRALAVQTADGRRALLLAEDVLAVEREYRWVVAPSHPALLELEAPHVVADGERLTASWTTTGAVIEPEARAQRLRLPRSRPRRAERAEPRPLWLTLVALYAALALIVGVLIALAFAIAWLVAGVAY